MVVNAYEFSPDQSNALEKIDTWASSFRKTGKQTITVGGYAGTGKTTLISHLAKTWGSQVAIAALCGKAAHVLRKKGVNASTIHSLIYDPIKDAKGHTKFERKNSLGYSMLIIDESSMVNSQLDADLRKFGLPIILFGDHGQLEPIGDNPNLMADPEIRLEKIHRQEANNPILRLAAALREGREVPSGWKSQGDALTVGSRRQFWKAVEDDGEYQFICGYNKTRHKVNETIRGNRGYTDVLHEGDVIICLKNNYDFGIFNGMMAKVEKIYGDVDDSVIDVRVVTDDGEVKEFPVLGAQFGTEVDKEHMDRDVALFDYGYCITCHKSQGSEYDRVAVLEEVASLWDHKRWSYTAATRAAESLLYCR